MAAEGLTIDDAGGARVLVLCNPPSNRLTPALRSALIAALTGRMDGVDRIILAAPGATFCSGLPLEPDHAQPGLAALCRAVEASPVPVVAALHGLVVGQGAELALAAHVRVAAPDTRLAFPEIAFGLCAEGGTTRRLAARVGTDGALRLLLTGRAVVAEEALATGLVDAVHHDPVLCARGMAVAVAPLTTPRPDAAAVAEARRARSRFLPAAGKIIACVEAAALMPVEAHLAFEAVSREDLEAAPEALALRAVARAERRAAALPADLLRIRPELPDRITLHGAAPELATLARLAQARGARVIWNDSELRAAGAGAGLAEDRGASGPLTMQDAGLTGENPSGRGGPGLHVHAGLASLPASPPVPGLAHLLIGGASGTAGLALCPAGAICEVSRPAAAQAGDPDGSLAEGLVQDLVIALSFLRHVGLQPVLVGQRPILGRGLMTAGQSALSWVAAQAVPRAEIEETLESFGARAPADLPDRTASAERPGRDEILARWLGALANEGLRLLDQGIARRPSDIDLLLVGGHGFPRWQGGPMHLADRRGLMALRADLRRWAEDDPLWAPAPLLDRLIRDGTRLEALNDLD